MYDTLPLKMSTVPRLRDGLTIDRNSPGEYRVLARDRSELFRLTEGGYFLLQQMDGLQDTRDVCAAFAAHFDEEFSEQALIEWIEQLASAGALLEDGRALRILRYLDTQGIHFRRPAAERREEARAEGDAPRREEASQVAPWFDHAIYLLNEGRLDESLDVLERMAEALPGDTRLQETLRHLHFLRASEDLPELTEDRRDVSWASFDAALRNMLQRGQCPRCNESFRVELGGMNRCWSCGASFSAWVLEQEPGERRQE